MDLPGIKRAAALGVAGGCGINYQEQEEETI